MSSPQTYDSLDGRMIHREGRSGKYVRLTDYDALEKRLTRDSDIVLRDDFLTAERIEASVKAAEAAADAELKRVFGEDEVENETSGDGTRVDN